MAHIGETIRDFRKKNKIKVTDIIKKGKISRPTYWRYEKTGRFPAGFLSIMKHDFGFIENEEGTPLAEEGRVENSAEEGGDMERIKQAASILGSGTIYSKLLSVIIKSFHEEWEKENIRPTKTGEEIKT